MLRDLKSQLFCCHTKFCDLFSKFFLLSLLLKSFGAHSTDNSIFASKNSLNSVSSDFGGSDKILKNEFSSKGGCLNQDEIHLTAPELIKHRGFRFEDHEMTTKDGYILHAHRIPAPGKPVVVAFHGMFQSSRDFLMNCGRKPFPFKMWDGGFDVWLANVRGNLYSRGHLSLNADKDLAYWNFSVDAVVKYDVPTIIDYILNKTGAKKLNWVGYSLGTAVALGLGSVHPEYYEKINLLFLLGTTAHNGNTKSPLIRPLAPFNRLQDIMMTTFNHGETLPLFLFPIIRKLLPMICMPEAKLNMLGFCSYFLFIVAGFNPAQANPTILPMMLGGTPGTLSIKMLSQWYQWIKSGQFSYYDYGRSGNFKEYGTALPPNYDLSKVTVKVVQMWGQNDWLSVPKDVNLTASELPNVVLNQRVSLDTWNHLDFIYGKDADLYVYQEIISAIRKFS